MLIYSDRILSISIIHFHRLLRLQDEKIRKFILTACLPHCLPLCLSFTLTHSYSLSSSLSASLYLSLSLPLPQSLSLYLSLSLPLSLSLSPSRHFQSQSQSQYQSSSKLFTSADRSSEAFTSKGRYPQCEAIICASVVLPVPGGPAKRITLFSGLRSTFYVCCLHEGI